MLISLAYHGLSGARKMRIARGVGNNHCKAMGTLKVLGQPDDHSRLVEEPAYLYAISESRPL
jgi:hypothetical protein